MGTHVYAQIYVVDPSSGHDVSLDRSTALRGARLEEGKSASSWFHCSKYILMFTLQLGTPRHTWLDRSASSSEFLPQDPSTAFCHDF